MDKHEHTPHFEGTWLIVESGDQFIVGRLHSYMASPDDEPTAVGEKTEIAHRTVLAAFAVELLPNYELRMDTLNIPMPDPGGQGVNISTSRIQTCFNTLGMPEQFPVHVILTGQPKIAFVSQMPEDNKGYLKHLIDKWEKQLHEQKEQMRINRLRAAGLLAANAEDIAKLARH
jgi:hypothetical protein